MSMFNYVENKEKFRIVTGNFVVSIRATSPRQKQPCELSESQEKQRRIEARDLLEIVEAKYQTVSTIFCSQFDTQGWYESIGEATLADAILDRITHDSYSLLIDGEVPMRERHGIKQ